MAMITRRCVALLVAIGIVVTATTAWAGLTHYWYRPHELNDRQFKRLVADVKTLLRHLPRHYQKTRLRLASCAGVKGTKPQLDDRAICFNGEKPNDSEPFFLPRRQHAPQGTRPGGLVFSFCKTQYRPYDLAVMVTLVALKVRFPKVIIKSDMQGPWWGKALEVYRQTFPRRRVSQAMLFK